MEKRRERKKLLEAAICKGTKSHSFYHLVPSYLATFQTD